MTDDVVFLSFFFFNGCFSKADLDPRENKREKKKEPTFSVSKPDIYIFILHNIPTMEVLWSPVLKKSF